MIDRRASFRLWAVGAAAWALLVTAAMAWPLLYPPVEPKGASFREDTFGLQMFDMKGDDYAAIKGAVAAGALVMTELSDGFRLFTPGTMSRLQQSRRVKTAGQIVALHVADERQLARGPLAVLWAGLALGVPLLALGGLAIRRWSRPGLAGAGGIAKPTA